MVVPPRGEPSRSASQGRAGQEVQPWPARTGAPPDVIGDILSEARWPDAAEPVAVHVRPELYALICRQSGKGSADDAGRCNNGPWDGIRLVVDDEMPATPGYEIHRAEPRDRGPLSVHRPWSSTPTRLRSTTTSTRRSDRISGPVPPERLAG